MPCCDVTAGHYYSHLMTTAHASCHWPAPARFTEHGQLGIVTCYRPASLPMGHAPCCVKFVSASLFTILYDFHYNIYHSLYIAFFCLLLDHLHPPFFFQELRLSLCCICSDAFLTQIGRKLYNMWSESKIMVVHLSCILSLNLCFTLLTALVIITIAIVTLLWSSFHLSGCVTVEYSGIILASEQVWSATHLQARWLPDARHGTVWRTWNCTLCCATSVLFCWQREIWTVRICHLLYRPTCASVWFNSSQIVKVNFVIILVSKHKFLHWPKWVL